jgi:hypothetical protein
VQQLVHHALQLMLVGIHIHIKWAKQEKQLARSYTLHVEFLERFNIAQVCKPVKQSLWSIKIQKPHSLKSQISAS